jgi:hypothetical protein
MLPVEWRGSRIPELHDLLGGALAKEMCCAAQQPDRVSVQPDSWATTSAPKSWRKIVLLPQLG